jgi:predicted dehydrogenase/NADPH:quinone reductase-like Zn-dependent oxidoreductase
MSEWSFWRKRLREVLQSLRAASVDIADVAAPVPGPGQLLIRTMASVVSAGTERMLVEFAGAGLVGKARQQPERVREVTQKVLTDGLMTTVDAVRSRLNEPLALGYANAGVVVGLGAGVQGFRVGQLVASNGPHAELICIPTTLCAPVPDGVPAEHAAFATLGAIAMQGIRLAGPTIGERFVVTGLGLIGLLTVQILRANGCSVLGIDPDPTRLDLAKSFGAEVVSTAGEPVAAAERFSRDGVDGVIVTASTSSSEPVRQAATMCRKRGRIVLVGVTGLELQRRDFYDKELSFQVSCSYGPGRYDSSYEDDAHDFPLGFVRWTAARNMAAVMELIQAGRLDISTLVSHRFALEQAEAAYTTLKEDRSALGIVLEYPAAVAEAPPSHAQVPDRPVTSADGRRSPSRAGIGVIGAGRFASAILLPALVEAGADIRAIASRGGLSASVAAKQFSIPTVATDAQAVLDDPDIGAVVIVTRHDTHASLVVSALDAGKHVFVEKPLAIDDGGLEQVLAARERWVEREGSEPIVHVGFNRRFAPITVRMTALLAPLSGPRAISITVNAGAIPATHWIQDPLKGGGRIVGEGCHFVDLARHLAGSPIVEVSATYLGRNPLQDSAVITLRHRDGSVATIQYLANGSKRHPKERVTVFCDGRVMVNDNFRRLAAFGTGVRRPDLGLRQEKGHLESITRFLSALRGKASPPIAFEELVEVTAATLLAAPAPKTAPGFA